MFAKKSAAKSVGAAPMVSKVDREDQLLRDDERMIPVLKQINDLMVGYCYNRR